MAQPTVGELKKLGYPENLADGVVKAIEFYKDIDLDRFRNAVKDSLRFILPEGKARTAVEARAPVQKKAAPPPMKESETKEEELQDVEVGSDEEDTVLKIIESLDTGPRGVKWDAIVEAAKAKKIDKVRLEEIVASLLDKGDIYEPELGMMKRI
jgi:hypothetical protein